MTEIILHAGFHKTGSSSIQHTFSGLELPEIEYLDWGHFNHSMPFLDGFTNGETELMKSGGGHKGSAAAKAALEKLETGLKSVTKPKVILSAESFSVAGYRPGLERLRDKLRQYADRIRVIAYVRPMETLIASDFQQCARAGLRVGFGRSADYLQRMQMLDQVFGAENVQFHIFSPATLMGKDVVRDFASRIGASISSDQIKRANESVSLETVAVARCAALYGEVGVGDDVRLDLNYFATNQLAPLGKTKFRIAPDVIEQLVKPFRAEMIQVQRRIGGMFPVFEAKETGGIRSDADLFMLAAELEEPLSEIVQGFAGQSQHAAQIVDKGQVDAARETLPELRVARLVDTIKRVRMAQTDVARAA